MFILRSNLTIIKNVWKLDDGQIPTKWDNPNCKKKKKKKIGETKQQVLYWK